MNNIKEINGKYYQECEVVMLSTEDNTALLCIDDNSRKLFKFGPKEALWGYQHLYFLSNEEIKEGELFIDLREKTPDKEYIYTAGLGGHAEFANKIGKKIIVTTDISLLKSYSEQTLNDFACLPQPSKEFIQAFIKAYNESKPITKVLVEYDVITLNEDWSKRPVVVTNEYKLKVNSSNEITIKKVKDSWTKVELRPIFLKLCHDTADYIEKGYDEKTEFNIDKWIEENL